VKKDLKFKPYYAILITLAFYNLFSFISFEFSVAIIGVFIVLFQTENYKLKTT
jgi:membrane glycosyltransferase